MDPIVWTKLVYEAEMNVGMLMFAMSARLSFQYAESALWFLLYLKMELT